MAGVIDVGGADDGGSGGDDDDDDDDEERSMPRVRNITQAIEDMTVIDCQSNQMLMIRTATVKT